MNKLFVWRGDGVLERYSSGTAIAFAPDVERARSMIYDAISKELAESMNPELGDDFKDDFDLELIQKTVFLNADPEVFETEHIELCKGSE